MSVQQTGIWTHPLVSVYTKANTHTSNFCPPINISHYLNLNGQLVSVLSWWQYWPLTLNNSKWYNNNNPCALWPKNLKTQHTIHWYCTEIGANNNTNVYNYCQMNSIWTFKWPMNFNIVHLKVHSSKCQNQFKIKKEHIKTIMQLY